MSNVEGKVITIQQIMAFFVNLGTAYNNINTKARENI